MKTGIIISIAVSAWFFINGGAAFSDDVDLYYVEGYPDIVDGNIIWHGTAPIAPNDNYDPQGLATMGHLAPTWVYDDDVCDDEDSFWYVTNHDDENYDYNYMLIKWENEEYDRAIFRWRVRTDSLKVVNLYRWVSINQYEGYWDHIQMNDGGWGPDTETIEVTDYFGPQYCLLLIQGYTPDNGDNSMECDLADLQVVR